MYATSFISIHAPIVGCDHDTARSIKNGCIFQSTHPSWGATAKQSASAQDSTISIHAPIVGCDKDKYPIWFKPSEISIHAPIVGCDGLYGEHIPLVINFNPRTHRGVRQVIKYHYKRQAIFQSTHPSWGAT